MSYNQQQRQRVNLALKISILLTFISGFIIFMYPFIANNLNNYLVQHELQVINEKNQSSALKKIKNLQNRATKTTEQLGVSSVNSMLGSTHTDRLSPSNKEYQKHLIGSITIPKIEVNLPIFDTTTENLLSTGITRLPGSSYPIGGKSTHAVLLGHAGLPDQKLFTDLDKLKKQDIFYIEAYGKKVAYKIFRIKIVKPDNLNDIKIVPNQDLVTLVTCTPYMVNTDRLLVTGKRVAISDTNFTHQQNHVKRQQTVKMIITISFVSIIVLGTLILLYIEIYRFRKKGK